MAFEKYPHNVGYKNIRHGKTDFLKHYNFDFAEEPHSNHLCPRRNGYFAHPDEKVCNIFYNCIEGEATEIVCPTGLHFDEYSGTCVWPDSAGRTGCGEPETSMKPVLIQHRLIEGVSTFDFGIMSLKDGD